MRMKSIGEHAAGAPHESIEPSRDSHREPLHRAGKRARVDGFDHEVHMIPLHRIFANTRRQPLRGARECTREDAKAAPAPQIPHVRQHAEGDVHRKAARERRPPGVGNACARAFRLPPRADAPSTPACVQWKRELSGR